MILACRMACLITCASTFRRRWRYQAMLLAVVAEYDTWFTLYVPWVEVFMRIWLTCYSDIKIWYMHKGILRKVFLMKKVLERCSSPGSSWTLKLLKLDQCFSNGTSVSDCVGFVDGKFGGCWPTRHDISWHWHAVCIGKSLVGSGRHRGGLLGFKCFSLLLSRST